MSSNVWCFKQGCPNQAGCPFCGSSAHCGSHHSGPVPGGMMQLPTPSRQQTPVCDLCNKSGHTRHTHVCAQCGGTGHRARHCTSGQTCSMCGGHGHPGRTCPNLGNFLYHPTSAVSTGCSLCGDQNHHVHQHLCGNCGFTGHWARNCPNTVRVTRLYLNPSHSGLFLR